MKLIINNMDLSELYSAITWTGAKEQVAREVNFGIISSSTDPNLPLIDINLDDKVLIFNDEDVEIFRGNIWSREKTLQSNFIEIVAFDDLIRANKTEVTFNFTQQTPKEITKEVCKEIGLEVGELVKGSPIDRIFENEPAYNIIMTAYTMEYRKTDKPYICLMKEGKVNVVEKGVVVAKYVLDGTTNLFDSTYSENMEDAVSTVRMFSEEGLELGQLTSETPGGISKIYKQANGENAEEMAKEIMKGIERNATVRTLGRFDLITGNAVVVKEPYTGLDGLFYIDSDTHTFENGIHMVEMELAFENLMNEMDSGGEEEEEDGEFGEFEGGSVQEKVWNALIAAGYSKEAVAAIMGNIQQESGFNPNALNSIGAFGLCQWLGSRRTDLQNFAKSKGTTEKDVNTQIQFLIKELQGSQWMSSKAGMTIEQFKKCTDIRKATEAFCWGFERPGKSEANISNRVNSANSYYSQLKNYKPSSGGKSGSGGSSILKAGEKAIGAKYLYGGDSPGSGIDCSGFVKWAYTQAGKNIKGRMTTRSLRENPSQHGFKEIPWSSRQPGDLIWMKGHMALQYTDGKILESGGISSGVLGYSGVAITRGEGRAFNKAYRYVGY